MESRLNKYNEENNENTTLRSRRNKNQELYNNIVNDDLEGVNITANQSVLNNNVRDININQVKDMLDKKYRDSFENKNVINIPEKEEINVEYEKTREYDINEILNSARSKNTKSNYEEERLKKLHDTQFDILRKLDIEKQEKLEKTDNMGLMDLINTITEKELTNTAVDPLDILSDLKGDNENTKVLGTVTSEEDIKEELVKDSNPINTQNFTDSIEFKSTDFDDFSDIKNDKSHRTLINILLVVLLILFVGGLFLLLNFVFGWGLF